MVGEVEERSKRKERGWVGKRCKEVESGAEVVAGERA